MRPVMLTATVLFKWLVTYEFVSFKGLFPPNVLQITFYKGFEIRFQKTDIMSFGIQTVCTCQPYTQMYKHRLCNCQILIQFGQLH